MLTWFVALWLSLFGAPTAHQVEAFRATAPDYLTDPSFARAHLIAARAAAAVYHVPAEMLLAIAHHESRYTPTTRTPEPRNRVSCGVMTPVPRMVCPAAELTVAGGYAAGAAHLRVWLDLCQGNMRCALLAYAGGFTLVEACRERSDGACGFPDVIRHRAAWIRRVTR